MFDVECMIACATFGGIRAKAKPFKMVRLHAGDNSQTMAYFLQCAREP
jgi:hypothetical protein